MPGQEAEGNRAAVSAGAGDRERMRDSFWTAANVLSLLRVALVAPTLWAIWMGESHQTLMLVLVWTMIVSDWLDGILARYRGETSRWGRILDPLADKLAIDSIAVALVLLKGLPAWVAVVVVTRDVCILLAGAFLLKRERAVPPSNLWGKLTSLSMALLLLAYATDFYEVQALLLVCSGSLLVLSLASYGWAFYGRLRKAARA